MIVFGTYIIFFLAGKKLLFYHNSFQVIQKYMDTLRIILKIPHYLIILAIHFAPVLVSLHSALCCLPLPGATALCQCANAMHLQHRKNLHPHKGSVQKPESEEKFY